MVSGVSNIEHIAVWKNGKLRGMSKEIYILKVERDGEDGLILTFSDGTLAGYVVEELLSLIPIREAAKKPVVSSEPTNMAGKDRYSMGAPYLTRI